MFCFSFEQASNGWKKSPPAVLKKFYSLLMNQVLFLRVPSVSL